MPSSSSVSPPDGGRIGGAAEDGGGGGRLEEVAVAAALGVSWGLELVAGARSVTKTTRNNIKTTKPYISFLRKIRLDVWKWSHLLAQNLKTQKHQPR